MKKIIKSLFLFIFFVISFGIGEEVAASRPPYENFVQSVEGFRKSQNAYEPLQVISNVHFKKIEDILVQDNQLYVVDSAEKSVFQLDNTGQLEKTYQIKDFQGPTGIALNKEGNLFIADPKAEAVFELNQAGTLVKTYQKPTEPLYGKGTPFKPKKIVLDVRQNLYLIGEGSTNGIIQLNRDGDFLGFFGANHAELSFFQKIKNFVLSEARLSDTLLNLPPAPTNVDIDGKGVVYSATNVTQLQSVKKMNIAGINMLPDDMYMVENTIDVVAGPINNFFTLTGDGFIQEYDSTGNLLFAFGTKNPDQQRIGAYKAPSAIGIRENGNLLVSDSVNNVIHELVPTDFAKEVHKGLVLYEDGQYEKSKQYWDRVSEMNSNFSLADNARGEAFLRKQENVKARDSFKDANNKKGYSDAFWEIRHNWMQKYLGLYLGILIILYAVLKIGKKLLKKYGKSQNKWWEKVKSNSYYQKFHLVSEMIKHPIDTYYKIRRENGGSVTVSTVLYAIIAIEFLIYLYLTGYIFNQELYKFINGFLLLFLFMAAIFLFIVVNYLVATINEGEGSFKKLYISTAYAFAPYLIGMIPVVILSNLLTLNEGFLIYLGLSVITVWTVVLIFLMIKEIHDFSFKETIKIFLLTIFTFVILLLVVYILYILGDQVYNFIYELVQEVVRHG